MSIVTLKPGREKSLLRRHPWIYSGAIARIDRPAIPGETVEVQSYQGEFLAWAAYNPNSQITARVWGWDPQVDVGADLFRVRLSRAISFREKWLSSLLPGEPIFSQGFKGAVRLVYAESDGLPGLIVDRYADTLVMQFLAAGAEYWKETLVKLIQELTDLTCIYERSDVEARRLEGLELRSGPLIGASPSDPVLIQEGKVKFFVELTRGHKTGFYLDQRVNRSKVSSLVNNKDVLDCFCYTGGFSINAIARDAASVVAVDSSTEALELARKNLELNGLPAQKITWLEGDVFQVLREFRDRNRNFDLIILDPPKFAPTSAQVERASRGYKDINLLAFKLLRPGGKLVTFSCSGGINADLFQKIVAGAALDASTNAIIIDRLFQSPDHPVVLNYPEGAYLKGLVLEKQS